MGEGLKMGKEENRRKPGGTEGKSFANGKHQRLQKRSRASAVKKGGGNAWG